MQDTAADANGNNAVFWGNLAQGGPTCAESPIEIRSAATLDGSSWTRQVGDVCAFGPDGGARVAWTDAGGSWGGACKPGGDVSCQTTHVEFACQKSGLGVAGQKITGCDQAKRP